MSGEKMKNVIFTNLFWRCGLQVFIRALINGHVINQAGPEWSKTQACEIDDRNVSVLCK